MNRLLNVNRFRHAEVLKRHAFVLLIVCASLIAQANGQTPPKATAAGVLSPPASGRTIEIDDTRILLPDVDVRTQEGKKARFYSDLVKDKVVLLSFFFTSCTYVCVRQGGNLSEVKARLGERLGRDVFLISISMDPKADTPQKLKGWGHAFGAGPGWTLVSSDTPEMNRMLKAFTGNSPGPQDTHSSLVFIGNDRTGQWKTVDGMRDPAFLTKLIEQMTGDSTATVAPPSAAAHAGSAAADKAPK
jgi:cytochrome oxidase Cu insertion factor (SCO1/SenC/PrrC family)